MSLYNMLFGENPASDVILATLGLTKSDVGRFRDCWVERDGDGNVRIAVYTRNGGGNRDCWRWYDDGEGSDSPDCDCVGCFMTYRVQELDGYLFDRDDGFDCTYATIYFAAPERYEDELAAIASDEAVDPSDEWTALLDRMRAEASGG